MEWAQLKKLQNELKIVYKTINFYSISALKKTPKSNAFGVF